MRCLGPNTNRTVWVFVCTNLHLDVFRTGTGGYNRWTGNRSVAQVLAQWTDVSHLSGYAEEHNDNQRMSAPLLRWLYHHSFKIWVRLTSLSLWWHSGFSSSHPTVQQLILSCEFQSFSHNYLLRHCVCFSWYNTIFPRWAGQEFHSNLFSTFGVILPAKT